MDASVKAQRLRRAVTRVVGLSLALAFTGMPARSQTARAGKDALAASDGTALTVVQRLPLGKSQAETPAAFGSVRITPSGIVVVDNASRLIRVYERSGRLAFSVPFAQGQTSRLRQPMVGVRQGDTTFVAELDPTVGIWVIGPGGDIVRRVSLEIGPAAIMDLLPLPSGFALATAVDPNGLARGETPATLRFTNAEGKLQAQACPAGAHYVTSAKRGGMIAATQGFTVAQVGARFACHEPNSPEVRVVDRAGKSLGQYSARGPWYVPPQDVPMSMRPLDDERFQASYTAHAAFWPFESGFVSVFQRFDPTHKRPSFTILSCPSAVANNRCVSAVAPGRVVAALSPDTIAVIAQDANPTGVRRLDLVRVRR